MNIVPLGSIKGTEFLNYLGDCWPLNERCAPWAMQDVCDPVVLMQAC